MVDKMTKSETWKYKGRKKETTQIKREETDKRVLPSSLMNDT